MFTPRDERSVEKTFDVPSQSEREMTGVDAIREAFETALAAYSSVFILGQGANDPSAVFGTTRGLAARFGPDRVFDTPVSEEAITGVCVGAAMSGLRPILVHNRPDLILLSMN